MGNVLKIKRLGSILKIEINRPKKMNAINQEVLSGLKRIKENIDNDEQIKVIVISSTGNKAFSAGADLNEVKDNSPIIQLDHDEASYIVSEIKKPVIAMIKGYALGGGCELALACDIRICSENSIFGFPEIKMGWIPGGGGTQFLPRIVGEGKAMELLLTGKFINSIEAKEIGLINHVFSLDEIEKKTLELAEEIAKKNIICLMFIKDAIKKATQLNINAGLSYEKKLNSLCFSIEESHKNIERFINRHH